MSKLKGVLGILAAGTVVIGGQIYATDKLVVILPYLINERADQFMAEHGGREELPIYLIPEIGVDLAMKACAIGLAFLGGLVSGFISPRTVPVAEAIALPFLFGVWAIFSLLEPRWIGLPCLAGAVFMFLTGALIARFIRRKSLSGTRPLEQSAF